MARAKRRNHHAHQSHAGDHLENEMEHEARETIAAGKRGLHHAERSAMAAFDAFDIFGGPMSRLMDHNRSMLQKMMRAMQQESLRFVNRRLEQASHAIESSRECHGVSGLMAVQQEWMLELARDYAEQTKRFAELMRELAEHGTASLSRVSTETRHRATEYEHRAAA